MKAILNTQISSGTSKQNLCKDNWGNACKKWICLIINQGKLEEQDVSRNMNTVVPCISFEFTSIKQTT